MAGTPVTLTDAAVRAWRWQSQLLAPRDTDADPVAIVRVLGAIQSQDPAAAALGLRARGTGFTADDVERARVEDRSVLRSWFHRCTIHLVPTEDAGWLLGLLGPSSLAAREKRFAEFGLTDDLAGKAAKVLREELADEGALTRAEIGERWQSAGIDATDYRLPHLITHLALHGEICDGPDRGRDRTWVRLADWVDPADGPTGDAAMAELARRHLAGHGPADHRDLAAWAGLKVGEARAAWRLIEGSLREVATERGPLWVLEGTTAPRATTGAARLLPAFDAYLLAYQDRELAVPPPHTKAVSAGGLRVLPAAAIGGEVVATWKLKKRAQRVDVTIAPFGDVDETAFDDEAADIGRFLGF